MGIRHGTYYTTVEAEIDIDDIIGDLDSNSLLGEVVKRGLEVPLKVDNRPLKNPLIEFFNQNKLSYFDIDEFIIHYNKETKKC